MAPATYPRLDERMAVLMNANENVHDLTFDGFLDVDYKLLNMSRDQDAFEMSTWHIF